MMVNTWPAAASGMARAIPADALPAGDDQDGRDDGRQGGIRRDRRADIHPAEGDHFQRTADDDAGFHIAENEADQGTGDQRTVELELVEDGTHPGDTGNDKYQHNLKSGDLHCTSPMTKKALSKIISGWRH